MPPHKQASTLDELEQIFEAERVAFIRRWADNGHTLAETARKIGRDKSSLLRTAKRLGIAFSRFRAVGTDIEKRRLSAKFIRENLTQEEADQYRKLKKSGLTPVEAFSALNRPDLSHPRQETTREQAK